MLPQTELLPELGIIIAQMLIKTYPEDFCVKEVLDLERSGGPYSYYILKKRDTNLFHVLEVISQRWKISRERFGFCGIKDKRAITEQYLSIKEGPEKDLRTRNFELIFMGTGNRPLKIGDAQGNFFTVTLRGVDTKKVSEAFQIIGRIGFANYFGIQRFTPDMHAKEPIAKLLLKGKFEEALKEYFINHPDPQVRKKLKEGWENLPEVLEDLHGLSKVDRIVLKRLSKKGSAEEALKAYPKAIKLMFFFSYQSLLWNRILCELIKERGETFMVPLTRKERIAFYISLCPGIEKMMEFELPYISEEVYSLPVSSIRKKIDKWIEKEGLRPDLNREVLGLKAFSSGRRKMIVLPRNMKVCEIHKDKITLQFFLPSGSYATIFLLKVINYPL